MVKIISTVGGLTVLVGTFLSLFIGDLGWWNYNLVLNGWVNAFGGGDGSWVSDPIYFADNIIDMLPGVITSVGGLLLLLQNKPMTIVGGILGLAGIGLFIYALYSNSTLVSIVEGVGANMFWWEGGLGTYIRIGYGWIITGGGSVLGLLGTNQGSK